MSESTLERAETQPVESGTGGPPQRPLTLRDVVPLDPWLPVRLAGFAVYVIGYMLWFVKKGLIIDRISVAISVGIFIVIGHLGRPPRRWLWLVSDSLCYCVMWFCYEESRGWADHAGFPIQVNAPLNIDRFLFFGTDPTVWLQQHFYNRGVVHWYDKVASVTYFTHFIFPVIAIAVLWVTNHREWARFMKRFASLLLVACAMFVLIPTAPPWMVSSKYHLLPPLARTTGNGFASLGLKGFVNTWQSALDWGNAIAAMPSLHAGFSLFVPAFFLPKIKPIWLKALVLCFPLVMLTSLVYFAEHWVIDGLVGWALVGLSFLFWGWFERRQVRHRAAKARLFLAQQAPACSSTTAEARRRILLDASFIEALLASDSPHHDAACSIYAEIVDRYAAGLDTVFALSHDLGQLPPEFRRGALAPALTVRVAGQHRRAAADIHGYPPAVALSLVMMRRERIEAVATMTDAYSGLDVEVISCGTEPQPALQSMAE